MRATLLIFVIWYYYSTEEIFAAGSELVPTSNGYFITGRGCGVTTQLKYLKYIPDNEDLENYACAFIELVNKRPKAEESNAQEPNAHGSNVPPGGPIECNSGWYTFDSYTCLKIVKPEETYEKTLEECGNIGGKIWEFDYQSQTISEDQEKDLKDLKDENNCENRNVRLNIINYPEDHDKDCYELNTNKGNLSPSGCDPKRCMFCQKN